MGRHASRFIKLEDADRVWLEEQWKRHPVHAVRCRMSVGARRSLTRFGFRTDVDHPLHATVGRLMLHEFDLPNITGPIDH